MVSAPLVLLQQYLEQIKADPEVCAISGQPPPPKKQRITPPGMCVVAIGGCCFDCRAAGFSVLMLFQSAQQAAAAVRAVRVHALIRKEGIRRVECKQGCHSLMCVGWSVRSVVMRVQARPRQSQQQEPRGHGHLAGESAMVATWRRHRHPHTGCHTARPRMKVGWGPGSARSAETGVGSRGAATG